MIRRRLFWKIYLTLLASLVAVAILMGTVWWALGDLPFERHGELRVRLADTLGTYGSAVPVDDAVRRLGDEIGTDISLYGPHGALIASRGAPITDPAEGSSGGGRRHQVFMRIDLPDGRMVLVRLKSPPGEHLLRIITAIILIAGGVGIAAFPMTARLTRQLEALRRGMARWGAGELAARVDDAGSDEVATVARTFNEAAARIDRLLTAQRALLANASHELRSPLARLRLAVDLWQDRPTAAGRAEIVRNLAELDQLVEEILLSSRLEHPSARIGKVERIDLLGLAAEEAARVDAQLEGEPVEVEGNEVLLRRLIRNLLENGATHGKPPVRIAVGQEGPEVVVRVSDAGQGIPSGECERIFEPFYRPAGRSESNGGWGLGLSLVATIAIRHGGHAVCEGSPHGGSVFIVRLPSPGEQSLDQEYLKPALARAVGRTTGQQASKFAAE